MKFPLNNTTYNEATRKTDDVRNSVGASFFLTSALEKEKDAASKSSRMVESRIVHKALEGSPKAPEEIRPKCA